MGKKVLEKGRKDRSRAILTNNLINSDNWYRGFGMYKAMSSFIIRVYNDSKPQMTYFENSLQIIEIAL